MESETVKSGARFETANLPDFEKPPVIETVLDVTFAPLAGWGIPYFGLFWNHIRSDFPEYQVQPRLVPQIDRFGKEAEQPPTLSFELLQQPEARVWYMHKSGTRLLQVQNDRFIHNWRKTLGEQQYPHYDDVVRPAFEYEWKRFLAFLSSNSLGSPEVRQCEMTYVNQIELDKGWETFKDLIDSLSSWPGGREDGFLPMPETGAFQTKYLMPNQRGRLHVNLQPAVRHADLKRVVQLTLVARGKPVSSSTDDILAWFDLGREWIVRGFTEFTSEEMHKVWKRKERA